MSNTVKMMEIPLDNLPPELQSIFEGLFGGHMKFVVDEEQSKRDPFDDPMVERLMQIAENAPMNDTVRGLKSFGFDMDKSGDMKTFLRAMGGAAAQDWVDNIMPMIIERSGQPRIDLDGLAACVYMMGLLHGIAFDKGCDGVSCEHCEHHTD